MDRSDFRFAEPLRVRWAEVDMQRIVFNGHYLLYVDTAMAGYWRALALPYHETMEGLNGDLYVRKATLEYLASARYDDQLQVGIRCGRIGNSSITFQTAVFRGSQCLVPGEMVYVFADPSTQSSRPVPQPLREVLQGFEAGENMVDVQVGTWARLGPAAAPIRQGVFVQEQQVPPEIEADDADAEAVHAVAFNRMGLAVGTGRLLPADAQGTARIGRMAVLAGLRGAGIGEQLLQALMAAARDRGDRRISLHAQAHAKAFYQRAGFVAQGAEFEEAGIAHLTMTQEL